MEEEEPEEGEEREEGRDRVIKKRAGTHQRVVGRSKDKELEASQIRFFVSFNFVNKSENDSRFLQFCCLVNHFDFHTSSYKFFLTLAFLFLFFMSFNFICQFRIILSIFVNE